MKDLVIIGAESFARLLYAYLQEENTRNVVAFSVNGTYINERRVFEGLLLVPLETLTERYSPTQYEVIMGVGYSKMNQIRRNLFLDCKKMGYRVASFVHSSAVIAKNSILGEGNVILENFTLQPFAKMGKGNLIWDNVAVSHDCTIGNFDNLAGNTSIAGNVVIGDNCYLGRNCTVFNDIRVADYTLVGGDACVKSHTSPYDVIVPARSVTLERRKSTDYI